MAAAAADRQAVAAREAALEAAIKPFNFPYRLHGACEGGPDTPHERPWIFRKHFIEQPAELPEIPDGLIETAEFLRYSLQTLYDLCATQGNGEASYRVALPFAESTLTLTFNSWKQYERQDTTGYSPATFEYIVNIKRKIAMAIRNFFYWFLGCPEETLRQQAPNLWVPYSP